MSEPPSGEGRRNTILVVTDTPEDLEQLQRHLGQEECDLKRIWGMEEALEQIETHPPDLVLLDVATPGLRRREFFKRLRSRAETEALPVIVIADAMDAQEELLDFGADGFICRPFARLELTSRVRSLLRMKDLHGRVAEQNRQVLEVNTRLDALNRELRTRNQELEMGMAMARRLQEALLPQSYPQVENVSFAHAYAPSEDIGGDVFQITGLDDGGGAIVLADVSGHGVRAALITSIVKTVLDYIDFNDKSPGDVLGDFNSRFRSVLGPLTPQIYATMCVMFVNGKERKLTIANAGHPRPLLISKERMSAEPVMDFDDGGPAIGFISNPTYPECQRKLRAGDIVLAFTDGLYEVLNEKGEMYGLDRLGAFAAANAHLIPRDLIQKTITETEQFMGTPSRTDDLCVVSVEIH